MDNIEIIWDNQAAANSFHKLKSFEVWRCNKLLNIVPSCILGWLKSLESLEVRSCDSLEVVFKLQPLNPLDGHPVVDLPLKSLRLYGLPELKCVWDKELHSQVKFQCLRFVTVSYCKSLTSLFSASVAVHLTQLEELEVRSCDSLEVVFKLQPLNPLDGHLVVDLPLKRLKLDGLPELKCVWDKELHSQVKFQCLRFVIVSYCKSLTSLFLASIAVHLTQLEELEVRSCDSLEVVFKLQPQNPLDGHPVVDLPLKRLKLYGLLELKCVWDKELHSQVKFQCLRFVTVYDCKSLTSLFPASIVVHLTQLEELEIDECGIVELIEKEDRGVPRFVFPKLTSLKLRHLIELRCIYIGKYVSHWPALKTLEMYRCHKVEILASHLENDMPLDKQSLFLVEKAAFPGLETLHITSMDNMEMIWDNQTSANSFPNLKSLCIQECNKLKCIWDKELHRQVIFQYLRFVSIFRCKSLTSLCPASIARDLIQLKELEINGCGIVELIKKDGLALRFVFPNLTYLKLEDLTELKCVGTHALRWPALKTLEVHGCNKVEILASQPKNEMPLHKQPLFLMEKDGFPSLETLHITHMDNIEIIWDNFQHLKTLDVSHCNGLSYMFPPTIIENLVELAELRISNCEMLTEVISDDRGKKEHEGASDEMRNMELDWLTRLQGSTMETMRLPNLLWVELECLPNLNSFLLGNNHTLEWPKLEELTIANCPKMTRIGMLYPRPPSFISRLCTDI